ncbi:MAG: sulfatase-like hydrolase/transferase [Aggregatilineales bacterium]
MAQTHPNIIIVLTDDQGYGDLSCMGDTDFRTPHLDQLAASGVRFTSWYANSPVCSPSRASLLTGRYPGNAGVRSILGGGRRASAGLPATVPTIATALKSHGYKTGMMGKWHLGTVDGSRPGDHGFDEWFGFLAGCVDYYSHIFYWAMNNGGAANDPLHDLWENDTEIWYNGEYLTDLITERAVQFIRRTSREDSPFFLYVPYNAPHYPMHAPQQYMDRFADLPWDRQIMAAMLSAVDDGVGAIRAELARQGQLENTIIFFMSDNGPSRETRNWLDGRRDPYYGGSSGGLKGHKFSLYEGGIRVPGIIAWGDHIPAGQILDTPAIAMDIFPTLMAAIDADTIPYDLDGVDLLPHLTNGIALPERDIFFEMNGQLAIRRGEWKLVLDGQLVEGEDAIVPVHLANLHDDMGEQHNLVEAHPAIVSDMRRAVQAWYDNVERRWISEWQPRIQEQITAD